MPRILLALVMFCLGGALRPATAQEAIGELDLLYPQFAHPRADAAAAIKRRDFRFITINPERTIVERSLEICRTKYIQQPFRIFATKSQTFSFNPRARA